MGMGMGVPGVGGGMGGGFEDGVKVKKIKTEQEIWEKKEKKEMREREKKEKKERKMMMKEMKEKTMMPASIGTVADTASSSIVESAGMSSVVPLASTSMSTSSTSVSWDSLLNVCESFLSETGP